MAKNKIEIASLDIDVQKLIENASKTSGKIQELKEQQEKLRQKGKEASEQFIANAAALKNLEATYKTQQATLSVQIAEEEKLLGQKKNISQAIKQQNDSENGYIQNNKQLVELKKQLRISDEDYEKNLAKINSKIAENNNWIKENGSAHASLMTTMDDYKEQFTDSFDAINVFNGGISGFVSRAQQAGGVGKLFKTSLSGMTDGIKGMGTAISANPIGVLLTILGPIIQKLMTFTPVTRAVEQAMAALSPVLNLVTKPLQLIAEGAAAVIGFFADMVGSMSDSAGAAKNLAKAEQELNTQKALQETANEKAKQQADELIKKSEDQTKSIDERKTALAEAAAAEKENFEANKKITEESYRIEQQKLAQAKNLNDEEIKLLEEGTAADIHDLMNKKNITEEELQTLQKAYLEKKKLAADEIKLGETQLARSKALDKDEADSKRQAVDEAIKKHKEQLALYSAENGERLKTLDQRIAFENNYAQRSIAILKEELNAKKISREQYSAQVISIEKQQQANIRQLQQDAAQSAIALQQLRLQQYIDSEGKKEHTLDAEISKINEVARQKAEIAEAEFKASKMGEAEKLKREHEVYEINKEQLAQNAAATVANAEAKLKLYQQEFDAAKLNQTAITAETIKAEHDRIEEIKKTKLEELTATINVNAGAIADKQRTNAELTAEEMDYLIQKKQIINEFTAAQKALNEQEKVQDDAQAAADLEIARGNAATQFEQQRLDEGQRHLVRLQDLNNQLNAGLIKKEQFLELEKQEVTKHGEEEKKLNQAVIDNKLSIAQGWLSNLSAILGKESAAGKAVAVAQATIDTYKSAVSAYAAGMSLGGPLGLVMGPVAAGLAVGAGLQNIKKITSTKTPKAEKGALFSIGGQRHSAGGTLFTGADGTQFEAEQGELIGVMNRNAARHFMAFNNAFPAGSGSAPNYFASGGIVSREVAQQGLNVDELAAKIAQANTALPAPVVAVQDIFTQGNSYVRVRDGANF